MIRPTARLRRTFAGSAVVAVATALLVFQGPAVRLDAQCGQNAIVCENALTGAPSSEWDVAGSGDTTIQGFATDISVNKGGVVHFKVTTPAAAFNVNIYRLGYYGGLGARKVASIANVKGAVQPACLTNSATFLVDCGNWTESTTWTIPTTAVSGVYIAKLIRADTGGASHVPFVVRDDASTSDLLFQTSDTTWQAYNQYGGFSLYLGNPIKASKVSYNRPFSTRSQTGGFGPSDYLFYAEYPSIRWLEANGYNVTYTTGVDSDRNGALIKNHKAFLSIGHDEYWSGPQRANVEAARAVGVHLAFFSGNEVFWKTRWENSIDGTNTPYRTLVCYKETIANAPIDPLDPTVWTGTWRDPRFSPPADGGRAENALTGQQFTVDRGSSNINVPSTFSPLRFWRNTSIANLAAGQVGVLSTNTLGYEWDEDVDNGSRPAGTIQLSQTSISVPEHLVDFGNTYVPATVSHALTLYRHSSGALVFAAGTVQWVWGLDPNHDSTPDTGSPTADLNIQQSTMNLLADMGAQPQTRQANLVPAVQSTDVAPPTSIIASPANGASVPAGVPVTISGTASDTGGGVVGVVEVSADGGVTWHRATGRQTWSYTWLPGVLGPASLMSRAADDSGNVEKPTRSVGVTVTPATCPCSIWNTSVVPWEVDSADASAIEVGVRFHSDITGQITGLRFYKASTNTGTHTGHLWTASGTLLGTVTFTNETASGWQQANFTTAIPITAGVTYIASYFTAVGHYSADSFYFGRTGVDQWPLHAMASNATNGSNGLFIYSTTSAFPTQTSQANNYWVDVVLGAGDTTPPTVTLTAPANGATVSGTAVPVTATAADNIGVAGVQFKLDGGNLGAEVTTSPYGISWNTTVAANGTHTLSAVARDAVGNTATAAVTLTVGNVDTTPPSVAITAPAGGSTVSGPVTVSATASDNVGIAGVQFLLDGAALGAEVTSAPYSVSWDTTTATNAGHTVSARARDFANNTTTSATVPVTVVNLAAAAPVVDVTRFADQPNAATTVSTTAFSTTKANELLLALISTDYAVGANTTVTGVAGGGLTWQLATRANLQAGTAEIWRAFAAAPLTNATVTATLSQGVASSMTLVSFSNVDTSGVNGSGAIGAIGSGSANPGAPTASLTTTRANSLVYGVGTDWDRPVGRTVGATQTLVHQYLPPVGDTYWVQAITNPVPTAGTLVTVNDTAPANDRYNLAICEVLAPAGPTWTISGAVSPITGGAGARLTLSGASAATVTADASGSFTFANLANGTYTVTPSNTGFTFSPASQQVIVNGSNMAAVNFAAQPIPTFSISGTVSPVSVGAGASVSLSGSGTGTVIADASGNFTFTGLANGSYTVTPSKAGNTFTPVNQTVPISGASVSGVSFTGQPIPTFAISGTMSPVSIGAGTLVTLSGAATAATTADATGAFSFSGLANGSYTVTPSKSGNSFTPANQVVSVNGASIVGLAFTGQATAAAIAIDASVFADRSTASTTLATAAFSTTAGNELLLAFIGADDVVPGNTVTAVTGGGLTWQLVKKTNAQRGTSEIWRAFATTPLTNVTVTATIAQAAAASMTVVTFTGVDTTGTNGSGAIGATVSASGATGAPTATVVTTRNNSWVFGIGNDWSNPTARTPGVNQTLVHQYLATVGDTYWVQRTNATTPVLGTSITINDTAPTGDMYNLTLCEILPAP